MIAVHLFSYNKYCLGTLPKMRLQWQRKWCQLSYNISVLRFPMCFERSLKGQECWIQSIIFVVTYLELMLRWHSHSTNHVDQKFLYFMAFAPWECCGQNNPAYKKSFKSTISGSRSICLHFNFPPFLFHQSVFKQIVLFSLVSPNFMLQIGPFKRITIKKIQ